MEGLDKLKSELDKALKSIEILQHEVSILKQKRTGQADYLNSSIKSRHMGEANTYIYSGLAADLPTEGFQIPMSTSVYFAYDTGELFAWDGSAWLSTLLS